MNLKPEWSRAGGDWGDYSIFKATNIHILLLHYTTLAMGSMGLKSTQVKVSACADQ